MKLFLASLGSDDTTMQVLDTYVYGLSGKTIAYIPTAANAEGWHSWEHGRTLPKLHNIGAKVTIVELEAYINQDICSVLEGQDIIWFGGGMAGYLLYWMRRVSLDIYLPKLLEHSLYVGSSAGSMIAGESLDIAAWFPGDSERGADIFPTLKLVNFDIFPHFQDADHALIKKQYKGKKLYILKDGEEIIVENDNIQLIGEERIIF